MVNILKAVLRRSTTASEILALIIALLLTIPPNGILSPNEENYFALAERFARGSAWAEETAIFDSSRHLLLSNLTLGTLISAIGYVPAQVTTRLLAVAGYTFVLLALFRVLELSALDAALAVMTTALVGQDIIGGEWLFSGYEAKVAAYVLVIAAIRFVLVTRQLAGATLLFVAATYIHFLVGGFWFLAAMVLHLIDSPRAGLQRVAAAVGLFALMTGPLFGIMAQSRLSDDSAAQAINTPPPDVIYSIIREPHHQSPFLSWAYFRENWLPGYSMAASMLLGCFWVAWRCERRQLRVVAAWLCSLLAYLFFVLGPKYLDRNSGILGKFYLFRPSSLILLLWLWLALGVGTAVFGHKTRVLRFFLLTLLGPAFLYVEVSHLIHDIAANNTLEDQKGLLVAAVNRYVAPGDIVLIDPDTEAYLLDLERRTGRPTLVLWKFAPTNDAELIKWYRRIEFRHDLFDRSCTNIGRNASIAYLLTISTKTLRLVPSCGTEVARVGQWVLIHHATHQPPAGQ
jgi:hypothetical protein